MRDYGKVFSTFWTSDTIRSLSEDGRTLAFYLLSCPHGTISGVFRLPDGYVCEDLKWDVSRVVKGFAELFEKGFANRCETSKWVWIREHFKFNRPENPNQLKSAAKAALAIPETCCWKPDFMRLSGEYLGLDISAYSNPSETLSEPFLNQQQQQEQQQEQQQQQQQTPFPAASPPAAAPAKAKKPPSPEAVAACRATWLAYAEAYNHRYGTLPTQNAMVNSLIAQLVKRLGVEASGVAGWFPTHPDAGYVRGGHSLKLLVADAEKLRTEWATGRVVTGTKASQMDRAGSTASAADELIRERGLQTGGKA